MAHLHDIDAVAHLAAEATGPVRDWALCGLAMRAPERVDRFPDLFLIHDLVLAGRPPDLPDLLAAAIEDGQLAVEAAIQATRMAFIRPADTCVIEAARAKLDREERDFHALRLGALLALLGAADTSVLRRIATVAGNKPSAEMAFVALKVAAEDQVPDTARAVAAGLEHLLGATEDVLPSLFSFLGVQYADLPDRISIAQASGVGSQIAGAAPRLPKLKGSRRARVGTAVRHLLTHVDWHLGADVLRAFADTGKLQRIGAVVAASWLATDGGYDDALAGVLVRDHGVDPHRLGEALDAVTDDDAEEIADALRAFRPGAISLASAVIDHDAVADALFETVIEHGPMIAAIHGAAARAAQRDSSRVVALLGNPEHRAVGLVLAPWVVTDHVLQTLLELPALDERQTYYHALSLASMGTPAVADRLRPLVRQLDDPESLPTQLYEGLTGKPLDA